MEVYKPGQVMDGEVDGIAHFGVFVRLGGRVGMCHISKLGAGFVNHPGDHFAKGERVTVRVLRDEGSRISLAMEPRQGQTAPRFEPMLRRFLEHSQERLHEASANRRQRLNGKPKKAPRPPVSD